MKRKRRIGAILAILVLLILARFGLEATIGKPEDPQASIREVFAEAKTAIEARNTADFMQIVSDDFNYEGVTKNELQRNLRRFFMVAKEIKATYQEPAIYVTGATAQVTTGFEVTWIGGAAENLKVDPVQIYFRKKPSRILYIIPDDKWQVVGIEGLLPTRMPGF
ncbi:MAG: hypothetical protein HUU60_07130 [Armatimonadetes bacterium]|nr:hypothetical protein [Armatimonadota bacterium]